MIKFILFFGFAFVLLIPVLLTIFSALVYGLWRTLTFETRFRKFFAKYANDELARLIATGGIWTGQTEEQLKDAKGAPAQIVKNGDNEIWIYARKALTPGGMRITLEQGRVHTWS